jgi:hypothetical protein
MAYRQLAKMPPDGVAALQAQAAHTQLNPADTGTFVAYKGERLQW